MTKTLNILTIIMAMMVLSAHILPMSLYLLDAEMVTEVNVNFTEIEEEKKIEKIGQDVSPDVFYLLSSTNLYLACFTAIPHPPHMEIPSPPPDML